MVSYWAGLAVNGVPGSGWTGAQSLSWPEYTLSGRQSMTFETPANVITADYNGALCDFWDTQIGYNTY